MISTSINTEHLPSISIPYFLWALLTVDYFLNARAAKEKTKAVKDKKKVAAAPAAKPAKTLTKSKAARPQKAAPVINGPQMKVLDNTARH